MLESALAYGRMRWRIFPCHSIVDGACSCGKAACGSSGKHPRTKAGFKEATDDEAQIRRWWTRWPDANIALATGSGIAVFDIDGEEGFREFQAFVQEHGRVPETLTSQTGRGAHLIFATQAGAPSVRSAARGKVHVRGEGGYIILPPSNHISGRNYQWIKKVPIATLPDTLRQWSQGYEVTKGNTEKTTASGPDALGPPPAHLRSNSAYQPNALHEEIKQEWNPVEQARLESALAAIPSKSYEIWFQVGMALRTLDWERSDGTDVGFELFDAWSQGTPDKYSLAGCEAKWRSFGRRAGITLGTIFHLAREHGWNGGAPGSKLNGVNGHAALPAAFMGTAGQGAIHWPDTDDDGHPKSTCTNAGVAVTSLGIACRKDLFHNRLLVDGHPIDRWAGEMSDDVVQMIRKVIKRRYGFDPKAENTRDACTQLCLENQFDPVCDYLDSLRWDGVPRLDRWLTTFMGAADSEYVRAVARLSLLAAVRRARAPGTKFDQIIVLEGKQGAGKSEAIRILAGAENFSDQKILGVDDRKQQELTEGVWLYEIAELAGLRRTEVEHVKAFVSRASDRARPAYGRYMISQPRRTVFFGSCNPGQPYLQDDTGNRRFWPVVTGRIDLEGLRAARDQLWAEAAQLEAAGVSHVMPEWLWKMAAEEQEARTENDEWSIPILKYISLKGLTRFTVLDVLTDNQFLRMDAKDVDQPKQTRAARVLRGLGYERRRDPRADEHGRRHWFYQKRTD